MKAFLKSVRNNDGSRKKEGGARLSLKLITAFFALLAIAVVAAAAVPTVPLKTLTKAQYAVAKNNKGRPEPNVLFLLDTGSPMTFSPKGIMPLDSGGSNPTLSNQLLAQCTYGSGARPFNEENAAYKSRYGRDLDDSNNIIGNPDCYYTSDSTQPYFLTFKNKSASYSPIEWKRTTNNINNPNSFGGGKDSDNNRACQDYPIPPNPEANTTYYEWNGSKWVRWFSKTKLPTVTVSPGELIGNNHKAYPNLVPNDSRMYMVKLVLWRLTDSKNAAMFSRMKVAMATSYQEENYGVNMRADFYRSSPYGATATMTNGSAPDWAVGNAYANYNTSNFAFCGVLQSYYGNSSGTPTWAQVNRAVLKIPFDRFYVDKGNENYEPTENLKIFRSYIDGVEEYVEGSKFNPELFADGQTPLSTSLYARDYHVNKDDSKNNKLIQYAPAKISYGSSKLKLVEFPASTTEGLTAGQAVGSAIDFFSPRSGTGTEDGLKFPGKEGYFSVTNSCQSNWVVVFTAGNDEPEGVRSAADAALELYKNTQQMRGREKNGNNWTDTTFEMEKGVRTLVVGFVDPNAADPNSVKLRKTLNDIAASGQPKKVNGVWVPDPSKKALFANDVPTLLKALENIFYQIDLEGLPGAAGAPIVTLDNNESGSLYHAIYQEKPYDQWMARFYRKALRFDGTSRKIVATDLWEAGSLMKARGEARNLYTVMPGNSTDPFANPSTYVTPLRAMNEVVFSDLTGVPMSKAEAFKTWLYTYDAQSDEDKSPLGDTQGSNFLLLKGSQLTDAIGSSGAPLGDAVFLHTNRGQLHALAAATGQEIWGFIPPNILKTRVKEMKFDPLNNWYEGDGKESMLSQPVNLLDGILTSKQLPFSDRKLHAVLAGTLGRGGNGLYVMDITNTQDGSKPVFLWAIDNARYGAEAEEADLILGVRRWGKAATGNINDFDYSNLGLTLLPLNLCQVGEGADVQGVGLLPGGLGFALGSDDQGKVFYVLDPETGKILKKMDNSTLEKHSSNPSSLGMVVTPVTYFEKSGILKEFLTADSEGNILHCKTTDPVSKWILSAKFRLTTVPQSGQSVSGIAIPLPLLSLKKGQERWVFGGTNDLVLPDIKGTGVAKLQNPQQFIFCVNMSKVNGSENTGDLTALTSDDVNKAWPNPGSAPASQKGWYLKLRPATSDYAAEYASTAPYFYRDQIIIATFQPKLNQNNLDLENPCAISSAERGLTRLYLLDPETGKSKEPPAAFVDVKITGITGAKGHLLLGIQEQAVAAAKKGVAANPKYAQVEGANSTLERSLSGAPLDYGMEPDKPYIRFWRELVEGVASF